MNNSFWWQYFEARQAKTGIAYTVLKFARNPQEFPFTKGQTLSQKISGKVFALLFVLPEVRATNKAHIAEGFRTNTVIKRQHEQNKASCEVSRV
jgi:hypothetical protein